MFQPLFFSFTIRQFTMYYLRSSQAMFKDLKVLNVFKVL